MSTCTTYMCMHVVGIQFRVMDMVFLGQIALCAASQIALCAAKVCLALTKYSPSHATTISLQVLAHNVLKIERFQRICLSRMSTKILVSCLLLACCAS